MGRGHRTVLGSRGSASRARTSARSRAGDVQEAMRQQIRRDAEDLIDQLNSGMRIAPRVESTPDLGWSPGAQRMISHVDTQRYIAALYLELGDEASAREHLHATLEAHEAMLVRFDAAMKRPRVAASREFIHEHGLQDLRARRAAHVWAQERRHRMRAAVAEQARIRLLDHLLTGRRAPLAAMLRERAGWHLGPILTDRGLSNEEVRHIAGDYRRALGEDMSHTRSLPTDADIDALRLLASAPERFGVGEWAGAHLAGTIADHYAGEDLMVDPVQMHDAFVASRRPGRFRAHRNEFEPTVVPHASDVEDLRARWHGLAHDPLAHTERPLSGAGATVVSVIADTHVIGELLGEGAEPIVVVRDNNDPQAHNLGVSGCEGDVSAFSRDHRRILIGARIATRVDGRNVECRALAPLDGQLRAGEVTDDTIRELVSFAGGWPHTDDPDEHVPHAVDEWDGAAVMARGHAASGARVLARERALGDGSCAHRLGEWAPDGINRYAIADALADDAIVDDTLVLSCARCMRGRVAAVAAHRLPDGHPLLRAVRNDAADYLDVQHTHEVLGGERGAKRARNIDELRARDGVVDLDPASYANGPDRPEGANRRPAVRSIAEAMRRR